MMMTTTNSNSNNSTPLKRRRRFVLVAVAGMFCLVHSFIMLSPIHQLHHQFSHHWDAILATTTLNHTATTIHSTDRQVSHRHNMPYTQQDIIRLVHASVQRLHVIVYHPEEHHQQPFRVYSLSKDPADATFCVCKEHLVELIIEGLLLPGNNDRNNNNNDMVWKANSTPLQIVFDTLNDYVYYSCMDDPNIDESCDKKQYPPTMEVGSVPSNPKEASFLVPFPFKHYNNCLFQYRRLGRIVSSNQSSSSSGSPVKSASDPCFLQSITQFANTTDVWDTTGALIPQLIWRGSTLAYLYNRKKSHDLLQCLQVLSANNLSKSATTTPLLQIADLLLQQSEQLVPRCQAVALTLKAEAEWANINHTDITKRCFSNTSGYNTTTCNTLPWINVKYTQNRYHTNMYRDWSSVFLGDYIAPADMAKYKYQIDLGGNGGTSWLGTITKLAMPGLLFHHVTPTRDWFYDDIQPWVHYVPIHTNLSNLYEMYVWAETHPEQAKQIAQRGQDYARYHASEEYYEKTFERFYVQGVHTIASSYQPDPHGETLESIVAKYRKGNLRATLIGTCDNQATCDFSQMRYHRIKV